MPQESKRIKCDYYFDYHHSHQDDWTYTLQKRIKEIDSQISNTAFKCGTYDNNYKWCTSLVYLVADKSSVPEFNDINDFPTVFPWSPWGVGKINNSAFGIRTQKVYGWANHRGVTFHDKRLPEFGRRDSVRLDWQGTEFWVNSVCVYGARREYSADAQKCFKAGENHKNCYENDIPPRYFWANRRIWHLVDKTCRVYTNQPEKDTYNQWNDLKGTAIVDDSFCANTEVVCHKPDKDCVDSLQRMPTYDCVDTKGKILDHWLCMKEADHIKKIFNDFYEGIYNDIEDFNTLTAEKVKEMESNFAEALCNNFPPKPYAYESCKKQWKEERILNVYIWELKDTDGTIITDLRNKNKRESYKNIVNETNEYHKNLWNKCQ